MALSVVTQPYGEPIHLDEARLHLKSDGDEDDALIAAGIASARQAAEHETSRRIVAARLRLTLDSFPCGVIRIPAGPVLEVVSVKYVDDAGALQTLDEGTDYQVDLEQEPARLAPAYGETWPIARSETFGAMRVEFIAGWAAPMAADATADTVTLRGWKTLAVDDVVRFSNSGGALPGGLSEATDYYVRSVVSAGVYTLSATEGGSLLNITSAGTGSHFVGEVPAGLKAWMKLKLGTLDQSREDVVTGVSVAPLPYVDRLLDPYRLFV